MRREDALPGRWTLERSRDASSVASSYAMMPPTNVEVTPIAPVKHVARSRRFL